MTRPVQRTAGISAYSDRTSPECKPAALPLGYLNSVFTTVPIRLNAQLSLNVTADEGFLSDKANEFWWKIRHTALSTSSCLRTLHLTGCHVSFVTHTIHSCSTARLSPSLAWFHANNIELTEYNTNKMHDIIIYNFYN
jgi:hypothetical protein